MSPLASRESCLRALHDLTSSDPWAARFGLGYACQLLDLAQLNELVDGVEITISLGDTAARNRTEELLAQRFPGFHPAQPRRLRPIADSNKPPSAGLPD